MNATYYTKEYYTKRRPVDSNRRLGLIHIYINPEVVREAKRAALRRGLPFTQFVEECLKLRAREILDRPKIQWEEIK